MRLSALVEMSDGGLLPMGTAATDPVVTSVVTTDLLDPRRYLSGGELVLTGLAWWRPDRPERSRGFVAALVAVGAAALAAGDAELGAVPTDLALACAEAGLPLLRVPVSVSFATIIEQANRRVGGPPADLVAVLGRHRALLAGMRTQSDAGSGLAAVLAWVGDDLGGACWVMSPAGELIAGAPRAGEAAADERERRLLARHYLRAERLPCRVTRPGGRTVSLFGPAARAESSRAASWVLAVDADSATWPVARLDVVAELVSLIALERELALRPTDAEQRLAACLGGAVVAEVGPAMRRCGLDPGSPCVVVAGFGADAGVVLAEVLSGGPVSAAVGNYVDGRDSTPIRGSADDRDVAPKTDRSPDDRPKTDRSPDDRYVLAAVAVTDPAELVARIRAVVDVLAPGLGPRPLRFGVSDAVIGVDGLLGAVAEARAAAVGAWPAEPEPVGANESDLATVRSHRVVGPEVLSSHGFLLAAVPLELRRAYRSRVLGPLLAHDSAHRTELVRTLETYLDCSGSWSRCAARMHVHVNTLRYRIERIEAITGRDLRRLADQADLLLALHLPH